MADRNKGFSDEWIATFTSQWNYITQQLKEYFYKGGNKDEEQCIQSECEHNEMGESGRSESY